MLILHSYQPSFFSKNGSVERRMPGVIGEGTPRTIRILALHVSGPKSSNGNLPAARFSNGGSCLMCWLTFAHHLDASDGNPAECPRQFDEKWRLENEPVSILLPQKKSPQRETHFNLAQKAMRKSTDRNHCLNPQNSLKNWFDPQNYGGDIQ